MPRIWPLYFALLNCFSKTVNAYWNSSLLVTQHFTGLARKHLHDVVDFKWSQCHWALKHICDFQQTHVAGVGVSAAMSLGVTEVWHRWKKHPGSRNYPARIIQILKTIHPFESPHVCYAFSWENTVDS